ncbi:MAG TPA: ATP synthase F0 subunit B [Bryobacteraceae bacterium]|jgi:F-type H+-transporting ATPase subunit b|nr:ATP synthase F0 subunit B [Bryobacteraceae bacterium]
MCTKVPRRVILAIALGLAFASYALPQESSAQKSEAEQGDPWIWWKWANFLILAGGLGYLIVKNVPPLFAKQSDEIQTALREAAKMKEDAAAYAAGIEARLAGIQSEIEKLRVSARTDMASEGERIRRETEHHLQRIREQTAQEIELMTRGATADLRKYAAELALGLAEQRIRSRMNPATQQSLAEEFLHDLRERTPGTAN